MSDVSTNTRAMPTGGTSVPEPTDDELRAVAVKRVKAKRDFMTHLFAYVVVNIGLWALWIVSGFTDEWVFPWPVLVMAIWGMFVLRQWFEVYRRDPLREDLVQREIEQLRAASSRHD
ncbi:MAG: 2TM domain-containing protein [Ilumatobacter sp.]|uniref:2TM domain-containing protein n=1 Tax=Ilumatobacter sp. TaxID=1967498 RepID=UPI00260ECA87|nr:2TM domain-containing protein [Ilumatobacter sp.]MDJ0768927.1 2TM domain-containing protein [Ilumatobacter sp.]